VDGGTQSRSSLSQRESELPKITLRDTRHPLANLSLGGLSDLVAAPVRCRVSARGQHLVMLAVRLVEHHRLVICLRGALAGCPALLRRAEVGTPDTAAALELLIAQSASASSSNAMRIRSHTGKSAVIA
jgi:hypothetical protein